MKKLEKSKQSSSQLNPTALANTWVARKLDGSSENGQFITEATIDNLLKDTVLPATFDETHVCRAAENLKVIAQCVSNWLENAGGNGRPLTAGELADLAKCIAQLCGTEIRQLRVHDSSAGRYHVPLFEGLFLTVNMHVWEPGEWTSDHDHGHASGGIAVVRGELTEEIYANGSWSAVLRKKGEMYSFDHWIHRMGRPNPDGEEPVSIHAYSGPNGGLTEITSFRREPNGSLTAIRTWKKGEPSKMNGCPCSLSSFCGKESSDA